MKIVFALTGPLLVGLAMAQQQPNLQFAVNKVQVEITPRGDVIWHEDKDAVVKSILDALAQANNQITQLNSKIEQLSKRPESCPAKK